MKIKEKKNNFKNKGEIKEIKEIKEFPGSLNINDNIANVFCFVK